MISIAYLSNKMYKFGLAQQGTPIRAVTIVSPPAPIVTVTGATYTGATLSWSGSTGTYSIVGSTGNTYSGGLTLASKLTKTVASVKLPQGGTYTAKVIASAGGTYVTQSAPVTIFVPYKPPTAPVIKTTTIGYRGVTLAWSASVSNTTQLTYRPYLLILPNRQYFPTTSGLTSFVPLTAGATYSIGIGVTAPGPVSDISSTLTTVYIPLPAKPSVPVLTASSIAFTSTKLSWTPQSVVQAIKNSVTYDIIGTTGGVTYASDLTVLSASLRIPPGTNSIKVVARAGLTFAESAPITVTVPYQKPTAPVLSQPVVGSTGGQLSWTAATGNTLITYSIVSALGGTTYATGLTGTSTIIPFSRFTSYGSYPIQVVATAGTTYSVSAGATLRYTPPPPDDILVNYLSTQGCQLSWAAAAINTGLSYSITELAGATFSVVQGPTFNTESGMWLAGVTFGSAQVYDFFVSGSAPGVTGPTSEIVVYVPPTTQPVSQFYNPGTYTVTIPRGFSGIQAQLVGGGGGGCPGGQIFPYGSNTLLSVVGAPGGGSAYVAGSTSAPAGATFTLVVGNGGAPQSSGGNTTMIGMVAGGGGRGGPGLLPYEGGQGGIATGGSLRVNGFAGQDGRDGGRRGACGYYFLIQGYGLGGQAGSNYGGPVNGGNGVQGCALITFVP